jgi:hypothetical protein
MFTKEFIQEQKYIHAKAAFDHNECFNNLYLGKYKCFCMKPLQPVVVINKSKKLLASACLPCGILAFTGKVSPNSFVSEEAKKRIQFCVQLCNKFDNNDAYMTPATDDTVFVKWEYDILTVCRETLLDDLFDYGFT